MDDILAAQLPVLFILRYDDNPTSQGKLLRPPPFCEFDELRMLAFAAAYPGNGDPPW